jgi:hypothetical protein
MVTSADRQVHVTVPVESLTESLAAGNEFLSPNTNFRGLEAILETFNNRRRGLEMIVHTPFQSLIKLQHEMWKAFEAGNQNEITSVY